MVVAADAAADGVAAADLAVLMVVDLAVSAAAIQAAAERHETGKRLIGSYGQDSRTTA